MIDTVENLKERYENILSVNKALNEENRMMDRITTKQKIEIERLKLKIAQLINRRNKNERT